MANTKWSEDKVEVLQNEIDAANGEEISYARAEELADELGTSVRSVAAKIRALDGTVAKKNQPAKKWTQEEADTLESLINQGLNDVEIAAQMGKSEKQVRGKALSMGIIQNLEIVKTAAPPKEKTFSEEETAVVVEMAEAGKFIEEIAEALDKSVRQIRGKLLSLKMTAPQRDKKETGKTKIYTEEVITQVVDMLEDDHTAEEISEALGLKIVGLKSWLGKNGYKTADMGSSKPKKYTDEDYATMGEMASTGATVEEVAEALGRTVQSVRVVAGKQKIKFGDSAAA